MDNEIQQVGFLARRQYLRHEQCGERRSTTITVNGNGCLLTDHPIHEQPGDHWVCSDKQKELILKLVEQHGLEKKEVEALAKEMFGLPVKTLNRLQASGLIEELLERYGKSTKKNGNGRANGAAAYRRHARA